MRKIKTRAIEPREICRKCCGRTVAEHRPQQGSKGNPKDFRVDYASEAEQDGKRNQTGSLRPFPRRVHSPTCGDNAYRKPYRNRRARQPEHEGPFDERAVRMKEPDPVGAQRIPTQLAHT